MKKAEKRIYRLTSALLIGLLGILSLSCVEKVENLPVSDDVFETFEMEGFIVGFHQCQVRARIGYIIVSNDLEDTVTTFSLSPPAAEYRMPTPVGLDSNEPLFTIPNSEFRNFMESQYFPDFLINPEVLKIKYSLNISYRKALRHEIPEIICQGNKLTASKNYIWSNNMVIVVKASKGNVRLN